MFYGDFYSIGLSCPEFKFAVGAHSGSDWAEDSENVFAVYIDDTGVYEDWVTRYRNAEDFIL
jgi:hypothetical protein